MVGLIKKFFVMVLAVVMMIMPLGNKPILPISIVNAKESEIVYPFGYRSNDIFVADAILGQARDQNGNRMDFTNISSVPVLHRYTYKTLAEGIIDNKWLLGGSVVWKNAEACLNQDFIGLATWKQVMYETLIMDWLTYQFESDEFKSELTKSSASYGWKIIKYLMKGNDIDTSEIFSKIPMEKVLDIFDEDFYKSIDMLDKASKINSILSDIKGVYTTSKDFYKQVSNILATQSACETRISFLREVQEVTTNNDLSKAIDVVIDKLNMSAGQLSFNEGSFVMAKQLASTTWELITSALDGSIPLLTEIQLGKAGVDWLFNTSNANSKRIELTILYMMNADFTKAYQNIREDYRNNNTERNAEIFNNAYLDHILYQAYASNITEKYIAESLLNGAFNEIVNLFSKNNIQTYNDLKNMLDNDITISQGYYNLVGKYYNTYEKILNENQYMSWYYDNVVHPTGVYFKRKEVEIGLQDDTFYFYEDVTVTPDDVTDGSVKYTSSDESVVTVKDKQVLAIEVHKVGSAIITVTTNDGNYQDTLKINVVEGHGKDGFYLEDGKVGELNIGDRFSVGELTYEVITKGEVEVHDCNQYATSIDIPKYVSYKGYSYKVTSIGMYAFYRCTSLTSISIPNSVTSIGIDAFCGCTSLTSITIPNSVISIEYCAFDECTSLTSIIIPNSVTSIGKYTFRECTSLKSITIPNSVTSIEREVFDECTSLKSITISNSVTSIGYGAFRGCTSLTSISIPNSVTSIGIDAFCGCTSLTSITIPNSVTSIGYGAFRGCTSLTSIIIPKSVTSIGSAVFSGCISLNNIIVDKGNLSYSSLDGILYNKSKSLLLSCGNKEKVIIPSSVTSIGSYAFSECTNLKSVTTPNSVTSIGFEAFSGCTSLTSISIPNSVTSIEYFAFVGCTSLTSITIPNSVTSIGGYAFAGCTSLTSITIPNSVTSIGDYAFYRCTNLTLSVYKGSYGEKYAKEKNLKYKVIEQEVKPTSIKLNATSKTIQKRKTYTLVSTITPSNTTDKTVTYRSSNTKVATVTSKGIVKAVNYGTAVITVKTKNGKTATCKVTVPYTVKYNLNGGTNNKSNPTSYYGKKITLQNPTRKGYVFAGWYSDSKYKTKVTSFSSGNKVVYAKWNACRYYVHFDKNGATSGSMGDQTCKYNVSYSLNTNRFKRLGYKFIRWNTKKDGSGISYSNGSKVKNLSYKLNQKIVLYAIWSKGYKVSFDGYGNSKMVYRNESYGSLPQVSKKGYVFQGWYTSANGGKRIVSSSKVTMNKNHTLYAHWSKVKYSIQYVLNGGVNSSQNLKQYAIDTVFVLKAPVRTGYVFKGWYSDKYYKTKVSRISKGSIGNKVFYAKWEKEKPKYVESLVVREQNVLLMEGESYQISYEISPENATNKKVEFSVKDSNIVSVNKETGKVKALSKGKTEIICSTTDGSKLEKIISITVKEKEVLPEKIEFTQDKIELHEGQTKQMVVSITPINVTSKTLMYSSDNSQIASIDQKGLVTANKEGTTILHVKTSNNKEAKCKVTVTKEKIQITTAQELSQLRDNLDGDYELANDIDLSNIEWKPIANDSKNYFTGSLNGNGHKIKGLSITKNNEKNGLFGYFAGKVSNLTIEGSIIISIDGDKYSYNGGFAGFSKDATFENCTNNVEIDTLMLNSTQATYVYGGGISGWLTSSTVSNCQNNARIMSVSYEGTRSDAVAGGICGTMGYSTITDCKNTSEIFAKAITTSDKYMVLSYAGGIVGSSSDGKVSNCVNTGKIHAYAFANQKTAYTSICAAGGIIAITNKSMSDVGDNTGEVVAEGNDKTNIYQDSIIAKNQ